MSHSEFYPLSSPSTLKSHFLHRPISSLPTPALILDRSKLVKNCNAMLQVCQKLGVGFRAHVKSHKTLELSKLQVGDGGHAEEKGKGRADFVVSTLIEAENLAGYVKECQESGRGGSILYGIPVPQSTIPRLVNIAKQLAPGSISIMIDNLTAFNQFTTALSSSADATADLQIGIFIKIDTGYQRAGVKTSSPKFPALVDGIANSDNSHVLLKGFYSHYGHSYAGNSPDDAAHGLIEELVGLEAACSALPSTLSRKLVLSVGATPTATAAQNMLLSGSPRVQEFQNILGQLKEKFDVELHAGVYPLLDCQQVATHARPAEGHTGEGFQPLSKDNIAIKMLLEVTSVYDERDKPEALVSAGSLALGREPCKSYSGWGIVTSDFGNAGTSSVYDERSDRTGWIVGRVSQEHGILVWEGEREKCNPLAIGDKVTVWPNHACVAGAGFGWYLVTDGGDEVVDVWVRWRGW
ncbi:putative serine dehydratase domain-containing protein [Paraphoma chrysanthemicola]|uniref:D-serine dehydratase n=1 Tax=Paraphoma chrysanthemicola TaxID=798071 RepID=A0A8K0W5L4_9PLEO|nr:putative serine dehydratase domain-containing protein [Paraphoma chrysanthemicola]